MRLSPAAVGACDFIRGWLHYCLQAYLRLSAARPEMFSGGNRAELH